MEFAKASCTYSTRSRLDAFTTTRIRAGGRPMRFYNGTHQHWCGIDLHAPTMYVCILDAEGQVRLHKNLRATPST
jgi:hypothetical protein